jgi:hypothetical protein
MDQKYQHGLKYAGMVSSQYCPKELCLFTIRTQPSLPENNALMLLGKKICEETQRSPGNTTTIKFDEADFFWLQQPVVWPDVIGFDAAFTNLVKEKGQPFQGTYSCSIIMILPFLSRVAYLHANPYCF